MTTMVGLVEKISGHSFLECPPVNILCSKFPKGTAAQEFDHSLPHSDAASSYFLITVPNTNWLVRPPGPLWVHHRCNLNLHDHNSVDHISPGRLGVHGCRTTQPEGGSGRLASRSHRRLTAMDYVHFTNEPIAPCAYMPDYFLASINALRTQEP